MGAECRTVELGVRFLPAVAVGHERVPATGIQQESAAVLDRRAVSLDCSDFDTIRLIKIDRCYLGFFLNLGSMLARILEQHVIKKVSGHVKRKKIRTVQHMGEAPGCGGVAVGVQKANARLAT